MKTDFSIFMLQIAGKCFSASFWFQIFWGGHTQDPLAWQGPSGLVFVLPGCHTLMHTCWKMYWNPCTCRESTSTKWTALFSLYIQHYSNWLSWKCKVKSFKVAEHSFQELMPNSSLLLSYLCFGARFLQESRLTTEKFILAFWLRCVLLPWQRGWLKTRFKKWFLLI